jgi:hypothetical protein
MPGEAVPIMFFVCSALVAIGWPVARAWAKRLDREGGAPRIPPEVAARLERMEAALDGVAVEVERIAEGQRFVTKLLAEPGAARAVPRGTEDAR